MIIIITCILVGLFLLNFFLYWIIFLKTERKISKWWDIYTEIFFILWTLIIFLIPIITSIFLSLLFGSDIYYQFPLVSLEIIFIILGIILVGLSLKFGITTMKLNKMKGLAKGRFPLITKGVYRIMRHPLNTSWAVLFLGLALIFESLIALIIFPFFVLLLWVEGLLEEKYILTPQHGKKYEEYKEKVRSRMFPTPYNALLILIIIFIVYVWFYNNFLI